MGEPSCDSLTERVRPMVPSSDRDLEHLPDLW